MMMPHEGKKEKTAAKGQESQHLWMFAEARVPVKLCCCHSPQLPRQGQAGAAPVWYVCLAGLLSVCTRAMSGRCFSYAVCHSSYLLPTAV